MDFFSCDGTYGAVNDREKGEKELRESVANGSVLGKALLGMKLLESPGQTKEALALIKEATEAGEPFGIAATGFGYELGYPKGSFATASKYYQQAAEKGCVWAMYRNGMCLTDLMMKKDAGHEWFRKAAAHGDGDALNRQGYSYLNGYKEEESPQKAFELFMKGAEKGNAAAMSNLGWCYEKGEGVEANKERAIEWYEKAIKYGDTYFSQGRLKALK